MSTSALGHTCECAAGAYLLLSCRSLLRRQRLALKLLYAFERREVLLLRVLARPSLLSHPLFEPRLTGGGGLSLKLLRTLLDGVRLHGSHESSHASQWALS